MTYYLSFLPRVGLAILIGFSAIFPAFSAQTAPLTLKASTPEAPEKQTPPVVSPTTPPRTQGGFGVRQVDPFRRNETPQTVERSVFQELLDRPVELPSNRRRPAPPRQTANHTNPFEDDDDEYVGNPFEDSGNPFEDGEYEEDIENPLLGIRNPSNPFAAGDPFADEDPRNQGQNLSQAGGGFVTPDEMQFTHLVTFAPKGGFAPRTPRELLQELNEPLFKTSIKTGYFRTAPIGGKLVGAICTHDPAGLQKVIESTGTLEFIKAERLTQKMFETHEKPLLPQADGGFVTPDNMRYTHLVAFGPKGGFAPRTPNELLNELNEPLFKTDIKTGYFRTRPVDGKLMGVICTHDPAGLQKVIESTGTLEFIKADRLTQGMFEALEKMP